MSRKSRVRRGFTLVELLVVMVIVVMVSVVALPTIYSSFRERSIQEAARLVQATFTAAKDDAVRFGTMRGVRFVPDPSDPGICSRLLPIGSAADYSEGLLTVTDPATLPAGFVLPYPCLMVEQATRDLQGRTTAPTSWPGNVRVGDRLQVGRNGPLYTVVGPTDPANPTDEGFVAITMPLVRTDPSAGEVKVDYLWLVNGVDDDRNGFADDGWDGVDNNNDGVKDEAREWEVERWLQPPVASSPYAIRRRPAPIDPTRGTVLPAGVVIDTAGLPPELVLDATGATTETGPYGVPSRIGLKGHEFKVHLIERGVSGNEAWITINARTGKVAADVQSP